MEKILAMQIGCIDYSALHACGETLVRALIVLGYSQQHTINKANIPKNQLTLDFILLSLLVTPNTNSIWFWPRVKYFLFVLSAFNQSDRDYLTSRSCHVERLSQGEL